MTTLRRASLLVLCAAVAGCFPVDQTITITENDPAVLTFTYSLNDIQIARAGELGLPVSKELAAQFVGQRGYTLSPKDGYRSEPLKGEGAGFHKFTVKCEATDRAARSPANQFVYRRSADPSEYDFQYDASIRAIEGASAVPFDLSPLELSQIGRASANVKVQFPGKILQHSGVSEAVSSNSTTITWNFKVRDLFTDEPVPCTARVKILSQTNPGISASLILLGAFIALVVALIQTILQTRSAADRGTRRGRATRKHGHAAR